jgi:hypothetical protein
MLLLVRTSRLKRVTPVRRGGALLGKQSVACFGDRVAVGLQYSSVAAHSVDVFLELRRSGGGVRAVLIAIFGVARPGWRGYLRAGITTICIFVLWKPNCWT